MYQEIKRKTGQKVSTKKIGHQESIGKVAQI
jgi:hypothetical protein